MNLMESSPGGSASDVGFFSSSWQLLSPLPPMATPDPLPPSTIGNAEDMSPGGNSSQEASARSSAESLECNPVVECDTLASQKKSGGIPGKKPGSESELCLICGDRASGYHYNALSCEGCKGFFRRSVTRGAKYQCKYGDNCMMDMWMRRRCQACRMKRCRDVGMREECLLSERQRVARNVRRVKCQIPKSPPLAAPKTPGTPTTLAAPNTPGPSNQLVPSVQSPKPQPSTPQTNSRPSSAPCAAVFPDCRPLERLSEEHRSLISHIVACQNHYDLPRPEDIAHVAEMKISNAFEKASLSDAIFAHMVEMTILVTRLIVDFAKHLPGFSDLTKDDQVILLKGSASEVMMLRTARRYDRETNTIVFGDGTPFTPSSMAFGGLQDYVNSMFAFAEAMSRLEVDNAEYALITALCIFSDRPCVSNMAVIERLQEVYATALQAYVTQRRPCSSEFLAQLLMKLVDLRSLSDEHSRVLYRLTIERGSLPPLLQEYFDVPDTPNG